MCDYGWNGSNAGIYLEEERKRRLEEAKKRRESKHNYQYYYYFAPKCSWCGVHENKHVKYEDT